MDELNAFHPLRFEREELPSFFFSEDTLAEAAQITPADLLESRAFAPYVLVSLMNATKRLKLYQPMAQEERILLNDVIDIADQAGELNRRACFTHVRDCGITIKKRAANAVVKTRSVYNVQSHELRA